MRLRAKATFVCALFLGTSACGGNVSVAISLVDDAGVGIPDAPAADDAAREDASVPADDAPEATSSDGEAGPGDEVATDAAGPVCVTCGMYGSPAGVGAIPLVIHELSGLAASRSLPGILYAHNDSGDGPRVFAMDDHAVLHAELDLIGAVATDWEDIEVGPCGDRSCVYVGDIGDNNAKRTQYVIYRTPEPDALPADGSSIPVMYERFPFVYPDGPHNAETLLVHPRTGRVFVVSKVGGVQATVYEMPLPLTPDQEVTLVAVTTISLPALAGVITGGTFHPCADRLLIRTYASLYELSLPSGASLEAIFTASPVEVPVAVEPQGEAVTYAPDGNGYFTASETVPGAPPAVLSRVSCP